MKKQQKPSPNQGKAWQRILKQKDWGKKFNLLLEYGKKYGPEINEVSDGRPRDKTSRKSN